MIIKGLIEEDFVNYKQPSMVIQFPSCTFKCERDCGERVCQNGALANSPDIDIATEELVKRYLLNPITKAVVCGGLEPMDNFNDLFSLIHILRYKYKCDSPVIIYTGYTKEECTEKKWIKDLGIYKNIIIKFGRFIPGQKPHFDDVLGVKLASDNQYAEVIS